MKTNDELYLLYQNSMISGIIEEGSFRVASISNDIPHRVGCSSEGFPMLFIECEDKEKIADIKLSLFKVLFNRRCSLADISNNTISEKDFTVIQMSSNDQDLIKYFFQVISIVLRKLPVRPKVNVLKVEISKVIEIFTRQSNFSREIVRGLWAELFVIERSQNPEYLIKAWHEEPEDRYDFNDSIDKVEVKSTSGDSRIHTFSLEQLYPNDSADLLIASVLVNSTGIGKTIFDIIDMLSSKITDTECELKLMEITMKTIGPHVEECANMHFDYNFASDTLKFYDSKIIPAIRREDVPSAVSAVHFRSNLTDVDSIEITEFNKGSLLFSSL